MYFTDSHEWIKVDEDIGTVGITVHGKRELGDIVYLEFPPQGKRIKIGEEVVVLESTKAAADLYAPVTGEIILVNTALHDSLDFLNNDPEMAGWLFKIRLSNLEELNFLMNRDQYTQFI